MTAAASSPTTTEASRSSFRAPSRPARAWALALLALGAAGAGIPSPLYPAYQAQLGFSDVTLTAVYAVYPLVSVPAVYLLGPLGRPAVPTAGHALGHRDRRRRIDRPGPRDEHRLADRRSCRLRHRARRHHRRRGRGRDQRRGQGARRPGVGDGVHPRHGPGPRPRGRAHRVRPGSRLPALRREPGAARRRVRRAPQRARARALDRRRGARRGLRRRPRHDPHRPAGPRRRGRERFPRLGRGRALPRADLLGRRPLPRPA